MKDLQQYEPPDAGAIADAQNEDSNLTLLLAQRLLYSRAKIWTTVRGVGVGLIAVSAPLIAAFWEPLAVWVAAVAAAWYVLNRVVFRRLERRDATSGATAQELFDMSVFGMPTIAVRAPRLVPEDVARIVGRGGLRRRRAFAEEKLRNWYPIRTNVPGRVAIAIVQRGNLAYTRRLLQRHATLWLWLLCGWALTAIGIALWFEFSFETFLLAVALPVMPPLVDAWDEYSQISAAGREREALANEIEDAIKADATSPIPAQQLLTWQGQLFALRRDSPLVPDWLYWLLRNRAEAEMSEAAETIGETSAWQEEDM
ncbi:MAG: hypothetical protein K9G24_06850 [Candidatus Nanopelagicales bacterium]|nr:hypothetical protein [Candidatus Nanopelagicales bacterium]